MPVHKIETGVQGVDPVAVCVYVAANKYAVIQWSQLTGTIEENCEFIRVSLQQFLDTRQRKNDLPVDDPDRKTDPNRPNLYWGDEDGTPNSHGQYLISRPIEVTNVAWDTGQLRYILSFRRV